METGPSTRDWLLFIGSSLFTTVGLVIIALTGKPAGYATAGFFGGCTALHGWMLFVKIRAEKETSSPSTETLGTTRFQSRPSQFVAVALGLCVLGTILGITQSQTSATIGSVSWCIAATGVGMLGWFFSGRLVTPYIELETDGIQFVEKQYSFTLSWDNISTMKPGEALHHRALFFKVNNLEQLINSVNYHGSYNPELNPLQVMIEANQSYYKTDLLVLPFQYGTNMVALTNTFKLYIENPARRDSLEAV